MVECDSFRLAATIGLMLSFHAGGGGFGEAKACARCWPAVFHAENAMAKVNLSGMTVEALMDLRQRVDEMLAERRAEIQQQLERMDRTIAVVGRRRVAGRSALKGRKVPWPAPGLDDTRLS